MAEADWYLQMEAFTRDNFKMIYLMVKEIFSMRTKTSM